MNKVNAPSARPHRPDRLSAADAYALVDAQGAALDGLCTRAGHVRDAGHGAIMSFSRNVFIPLTQLCRDVCHYCTFAETPDNDGTVYLSRDEVMGRAARAAAAGCTEVLFTLGDKPERRYAKARTELADLGHETTISYLVEIAGLVHRETGLLAHVNPGVMTAGDLEQLREVSVSQGLMLESASERLCLRGGPHFGSPDKHPAARLETLRLAGEQGIPFTTGLLIGIGETRAERVDALLAIRDLHEVHGHIQELIIQNFKPKPGTRMAAVAAPPAEEIRWTIAIARLLFGPAMNIQAPPNLTPDQQGALIDAGINDWGGVSPISPDYVNPEAPWPAIEDLARTVGARGKTLVERLAVYPAFARDTARWIDPNLRGDVMRHQDADGFARPTDWFAGAPGPAPGTLHPFVISGGSFDDRLERVIDRARDGRNLSVPDIVQLLSARGADAERVCNAADDLRRAVIGDDVTYVVNCNINYTNICTYKCAFCAFSKGRVAEEGRDAPYLRNPEDVVEIASDAVARGATEVCLQGGIHPSYTGQSYLDYASAVHAAFPGLHIHGFSPLEVWHGATSLGLSVAEFLGQLKQVGLRSLPGTAAEILDDDVRSIICPDKLTTNLWLEIMETAHGLGIPTTATIMFGHVEQPEHVARHLLRTRNLQARTGGFTEFVPLPFVHMDAPISLKQRSRRGPSYREAVLIHAVSRLALHPLIPNIQTSWVKMGAAGAQRALVSGANDLGGILMRESISRAAGARHGQEFGVLDMERLITASGRTPRQRLTNYDSP